MSMTPSLWELGTKSLGFVFGKPLSLGFVAGMKENSPPTEAIVDSILLPIKRIF